MYNCDDNDHDFISFPTVQIYDFSFIMALVLRLAVAQKEILNHMQNLQSTELTVPVSDVSSVIVFPALLLSACSFW